MKEVFALLPYTKPFLFVDELTALTEDEAEGYYTFKESEYFYQGHFVGNPITPGVILTECMAQIGLVSLGIHLLLQSGKSNIDPKQISIAFTESEVQFLKTVLPGTTVYVKSIKRYWRLGKLKCSVQLYNQDKEEVARGTLAGMIKHTSAK